MDAKTENTAPMPDPKQDRRRDLRVAVQVAAEVQIIFPEMTFTPIVLKGALHDINIKGAGMNVLNLNAKHYSQIIRGPRYCRIFCSFPGFEGQTRLFGKILHLEVHGKIDGGKCLLGIEFAENEDRDLNRLQQYLDTIHNAETGV